MEFLKKHYEKILLSLVLLGLAGAAAYLPIAIGQERERLQSVQVAMPKPKPVKMANIETNILALKQLTNHPVVDLTSGHNTFNPVKWKSKPDGTPLGKLLKVLEEGPQVLVVSKVVPLNLVIAYSRASADGFFFLISREAETRPLPVKKPLERYVTLNQKSEFFTLKEVKGTPEEPTAFVLELADTKETVQVTKEKPYSRVVGYRAELRYEPDNRSMPDVRARDTITLGGEAYKVVDITQNAVTVSAANTGKKTIVKWNSLP